jgi:hypothetical protein
VSYLLHSRAFDDISETDEIGIDICRRFLDRVAHARLSREMHNRIKAFLPEQPVATFSVREIEAKEVETSMLLQQR